MWVKLSEKGKNPSIPMKFSLGILQLGLGFLITLVGLQFVNEAAQVRFSHWYFSTCCTPLELSRQHRAVHGDQAIATGTLQERPWAHGS